MVTQPAAPINANIKLGRRALRNIALVPDQTLYSGQLLYGASSNENIQLAMLQQVHELPTEAPDLLTGMLSFTPNITVFEPGDEDVGRFADAYDQTITSRSADVTFNTDGANWEDLKSMAEAFAVALTSEVNGIAPTTIPGGGEYAVLNLGTNVPAGGRVMKRVAHIRQDLAVPLNSGQQFKLWRMMWEEGLDRMYVMPGAVLQSIQLDAALRREIRMSAQFVGADVVDVQMERDLALNSAMANAGSNVLGNYFRPDYPLGGAAHTPANAIFVDRAGADAEDKGTATWRDGGSIEYAVRAVKPRFTAQTIQVFMDPDGTNSPERIESDLVNASLTLNTGLMPSWRFGNLGFSTVVRARRGIQARLTFLNTQKGREQFQQFLRPDRRVQKIWMVFYDPSYSKRMILKANIRISATGRLPGDDGQGANTTEFTYRSVGVGANNEILGEGESDFELIFDDLTV